MMDGTWTARLSLFRCDISPARAAWRLSLRRWSRASRSAGVTDLRVSDRIRAAAGAARRSQRPSLTARITAMTSEPPADNPHDAGRGPTTALLSFISLWRAAAIVLGDLGSSAFYAAASRNRRWERRPWFSSGHALLLLRPGDLPRSSIMFVRAACTASSRSHGARWPSCRCRRCSSITS